MIVRTLLLLLAMTVAAPAAELAPFPINIIDGSDDREALGAAGPRLGLSADEITRIRRVSGFVGCLAPTPSLGSATLFFDDRHILTAAHVLIDPSGRLRSKCFFKNQSAASFRTDLLLDPSGIALGSPRPKPGSNDDYAIVRLAEAVPGGDPFPVATIGSKAGEALIVVSAHPSGMERKVDPAEPVVQRCSVRRAPVSRDPSSSSFYRTDCDATGSSSGGMHLTRIDGRLVFRGITISTGPWETGSVAERLRGAPYDELKGSVTTALGVDGAVTSTARKLLAR